LKKPFVPFDLKATALWCLQAQKNLYFN